MSTLDDVQSVKEFFSDDPNVVNVELVDDNVVVSLQQAEGNVPSEYNNIPLTYKVVGDVNQDESGGTNGNNENQTNDQ